MIAKCCSCGTDFLTEADPYVVRPTPNGVKFYCCCQIVGHSETASPELTKLQEGLDHYVSEASTWHKAAKKHYEELKKLQEEKAKLVECVKDFAENGTRHDTNPTGQFKDCGCFDSFSGDSWQGYIRSQDEFVRGRAHQTLKDIGEEV